MRKALLGHGFTIVEVMIFLAVTGLLLVMAMAYLSGAQARTRFTQSVRETDQTIHDVINQVQSGFFPSSANFQCHIVNGYPQLSPGSNSKGTNEDCVFIGKIIQVGPQNIGSCTSNPSNSTNCDHYAVQVIVGTRKNNDGTLAGSHPTAAIPTSTNISGTDLSDNNAFHGSLHATKLYEVRNNIVKPIGAFGFLSTLGSYNNNILASGSQTVNIVSITSSSLGNNNDDIVNSVQNLTDSALNPDQVVLCLADLGSPANGARRAAIAIGGQGQQLSTQIYLDDLTAIPGVSSQGGGCP